MFAILVPASLAPLIVTLFWAEQKAKRLGLVNVPRVKHDVEAPIANPLINRIWAFA